MAEPAYTEDAWIDEDQPEAMPPVPPTQDELPCDDRAGFHLNDGIYRSIERDGQGRLSSPLLGLTLVLWKGVYRGIDGTWLRWANAEGVPLPMDAEAAHASAEKERRKAEKERQRADEERARAERAEQELARLKALLDGKG